MKLVEILARELNEWPVFNPEFAYCDYCGEIRFRYWATCDFYPMEAVDLSDRGGIGYEAGQTTVTRAQWEAERARIAGINEQYTFHPGEAIMPSPFDSPRYDQDLWDKVALKALAAQIQNPQSIAADVGWCADVADAFMAERAKRLKGVK